MWGVSRALLHNLKQALAEFLAANVYAGQPLQQGWAAPAVRTEGASPKVPPHAKPCGAYGAQGRLWAQAHAGDQAEQAASGSRSSTGGTPQQRAQAAFPNVTAVGELDVSGYASVLDTVVALVWCVASSEALGCSNGQHGYASVLGINMRSCRAL